MKLKFLVANTEEETWLANGTIVIKSAEIGLQLQLNTFFVTEFLAIFCANLTIYLTRIKIIITELMTHINF